MLFITVIGVIFSFLILGVISSIWNGYAISVLWGWFITPVFGLPILNIPQAIGLGLIITFLTQAIDCRKDEDDTKTQIIKSIFIIILRPLFALLIGYIVHLFM